MSVGGWPRRRPVQQNSQEELASKREREAWTARARRVCSVAGVSTAGEMAFMAKKASVIEM
jgi:hypothetical protein